MKNIVVFMLLLAVASLSAFDLEYIRPVPLDDEKDEVKAKVEDAKPSLPPNPEISAMEYVSSLDYKNYDWELIRNAYLGNTEVVRILLERDANPNIQITSTGVSALQAALYNGNSEVVTLLLEKNADCIHRDKFERIPLFYTARYHGNLNLVESIRNKTDLIYRDKLWRTTAIYATVYENIDLLEWMLDNYGRYEDHSKDYQGRGPGEYAAANCKLGIIEQMVGRSIKFLDVNSIMDYAIAAGAVDIVRYLLGLKETVVDASDLVIAAAGIDSYYKYDIPGMQVSLSDPGEYIITGYKTQEAVSQNTPENYHLIFQMLAERVDINAKNA